MTPRWALKRGLKWAVEWAATLSGWGLLYRRSQRFRLGYRIITYHRIADLPRDSYTVSTEHFRSHMAFLADHHKVMRLGELVQGLVQGPLPEPGAMAITFDDGYLEAAGAVGEILQKYSIPATFFVITGVLDKPGEARGGPYMTWPHVKSMAAAGFSIGSHTVSHRSLGDLDQAAVEQELVVSRRRITEELGTPPEGLAYPYGTIRDFSSAVADTARTAGYVYGATAVHGLNHGGLNSFFLRRTTLGAGDGPRTFRMIMKGCLDPWYLVDRWAYMFQRSYDA